MKRRILAIGIIFCMLITLGACGGNKGGKGETLSSYLSDGKLKIFYEVKGISGEVVPDVIYIFENNKVIVAKHEDADNDDFYSVKLPGQLNKTLGELSKMSDEEIKEYVISDVKKQTEATKKRYQAANKEGLNDLKTERYASLSYKYKENLAFYKASIKAWDEFNPKGPFESDYDLTLYTKTDSDGEYADYEVLHYPNPIENYPGSEIGEYKVIYAYDSKDYRFSPYGEYEFTAISHHGVINDVHYGGFQSSYRDGGFITRCDEGTEFVMDKLDTEGLEKNTSKEELTNKFKEQLKSR